MNNNKSGKGNTQIYEQVNQNDDKSEIIIFQTNQKISVSCFLIDKEFSELFANIGNRP